MSESKHTPEAAPAASPWPHRVRLGSHFFENSYDDGSYYCLELRATLRFADPAILAKAQQGAGQ